MVATGYRHCCRLKMFFGRQLDNTVFQAAFMAHISELDKDNKGHHQRNMKTLGKGGGCILYSFVC